MRSRLCPLSYRHGGQDDKKRSGQVWRAVVGSVFVTSTLPPLTNEAGAGLAGWDVDDTCTDWCPIVPAGGRRG